MPTPKLIDLSALGGSIGTVRLVEGGEPRALLSPSAGIARKVLDIQTANPTDDFANGVGILKELMPEATPAEMDGLTPSQVSVLVTVVAKHLEEMKRYADAQLAALFPNGAGPTSSASA